MTHGVAEDIDVRLLDAEAFGAQSALLLEDIALESLGHRFLAAAQCDVLDLRARLRHARDRPGAAELIVGVRAKDQQPGESVEHARCRHDFAFFSSARAGFPTITAFASTE